MSTAYKKACNCLVAITFSSSLLNYDVTSWGD